MSSVASTHTVSRATQGELLTPEPFVPTHVVSLPSKGGKLKALLRWDFVGLAALLIVVVLGVIVGFRNLHRRCASLATAVEAKTRPRLTQEEMDRLGAKMSTDFEEKFRSQEEQIRLQSESIDKLQKAIEALATLQFQTLQQSVADDQEEEECNLSHDPSAESVCRPSSSTKSSEAPTTTCSLPRFQRPEGSLQGHPAHPPSSFFPHPHSSEFFQGNDEEESPLLHQDEEAALRAMHAALAHAMEMEAAAAANSARPHAAGTFSVKVVPEEPADEPAPKPVATAASPNSSSSDSPKAAEDNAVVEEELPPLEPANTPVVVVSSKNSESSGKQNLTRKRR